MCYPESFKREVERLYSNGLTQKEIAEMLNCGIATVKRIIKNSNNYDKIKQKRKEKSIENHKLVKLKFKEAKKQEQEKEERLWWGMIEQQETHARMISKKRKISRAQLVELSLSQYVEVGGKLRYIDPHHKPADLPRTYDIHNAILPQFKNYADEIESEKWNSKVEKEALK